MDRAKPSSILFPALVLVLMLTAAIAPVAGQAATACTSSLISSFTPCFSFLTGSTNGGASPTAGCCQSLASLISSGAECICLILTGNVPISLPINRTLALTLPKLCNSQSVPLRCTDTAAPLPSAGAPIGYSPNLPALPPFRAVPVAPSLSPTSEPKLEPSSPSPAGQGIDQGQSRPLLFPSSAGKQSLMLAQSLLLSSLMIWTILL